MKIKDVEIFLKDINGIIRNRGKDIYIRKKIGNYILNDGVLNAQVLTSAEDEFYDIKLEFEDKFEEGFISGKCTCPYFEKNYEDCKHIAAVGYLYLDILKGKKIDKSKVNDLNKTKTPNVIKINQNKTAQFHIISLDYWVIDNLLKSRASHPNTNSQLVLNDETKTASLSFNSIGVKAEAKYIRNNMLELSCNCKDLTETKICGHLYNLLKSLGSNYGRYYFKKYNDYTEQKNEILTKYGLKLSDELANQFEFGFDQWGNFILKKQPGNLLKLADHGNWQSKIGLFAPQINDTDIANVKKMPSDIKAVGLVFLLDGKYNAPIWVDGVIVTDKKGKIGYKRHLLQNDSDLALFSHLPTEILIQLAKITTESLVKYLKQNIGYIHSTNPASVFSGLDEQGVILLTNKITEVLKVLIQINTPDLLFFNVENGAFSNTNCVPVSFTQNNIYTKLLLSKKDDFWKLSLLLKTNTEPSTTVELNGYKSPFIIENNILHLINKDQESLIKLFAEGDLMVHQQETVAFLDKVVKPFGKKHEIEFDENLKIETIENLSPTSLVYLSELNDNFLMVRPKWKYGEFEVELDNSPVSLLEKDGNIIKIERNAEKEQQLITLLKDLHPRFKAQNNKEYFYLPFTEAMENNWFLQFFDTMQAQDITVYGLNDLKKFKYNNNKPTFKINSSSGIDWFDLKIEVHYGDQVVGLADLKKAILSKQQYILLKDGSLGILPEEWIKKYSPLLRMGQVNNDQLKVSKFHYTLLDELYDQIDSEAVQAELHQKRQNLQRLENAEEIELPKVMSATLRDYQVAGYQWLHQLKNIGWGGCLADDMGLGKTLQTLTFLQKCITENSNQTHLIVCPTSLIYNWESEILKFTPELNYYIHYGTDRHLSDEKYNQSNLIITSYGMVRSDIEYLSKLNFDYVILDESQAIKNPAAQITKAVQILKANNRLILSGTPIQNNTFDLFSQMNFLNPGMLGNMEFFRTEFANPIDKNGDKTKSEELRKLIYPFLLRRTKEQVAKDLPDKTETILWCEMEAAQRKVYDSYKVYYRENLMKRIAEDGMAKSSIYILEGLLKLRQICDSPALLKDEKHKNTSVKLEELVRELENNTGSHKVLVFSQFVEMLSLIKKELDKRNMQYAYLDGSTPAVKRKDAVNNFQNDDNLRIFLISLKAGGVGLNLTSADYVYLVDPWWNPATEQQAIDRTHRIGQTNKVFAYKMICKDTVEEKILQLQQKKKALAGDLIAEEVGFVKKLTKDDVAFLFS